MKVYRVTYFYIDVYVSRSMIAVKVVTHRYTRHCLSIIVVAEGEACSKFNRPLHRLSVYKSGADEFYIHPLFVSFPSTRIVHCCDNAASPAQ